VSQLAAIPGTIAAIQLHAMLDVLRAMGVDVARVLARAGLSAEEVRDPQARLQAAFELAVWDAAEQVTGDPMIGLRIAEDIRIGALGAYEYLLRNSPTMRSAIERAGRFERVLDDLTQITLVEDDEQAVLRFWREGGYPHPARGIECTFSVIVRICQELVPSQRALEVRFRHRAPVDAAPYVRHFRCAVRFGAACDEVVFPCAVLDLPMLLADPLLGHVLEEHMQRLLDTLPTEDPFVRRARGALLRALADASASLPGLAAALRVSPRTLRRRLDEHGTSYKALLDELRRELAYHCIDTSDEPVDRIANRLGFTEPSTFYRAFKRWSGTTPALYRDRKRD
jgi:AraC-like DNA-binding protein